jgi:type VI secretion system secreted protein VgrG
MAGTYSDNRSVTIKTPVDKTAELLLTRMSGTEQVSRPFRFELQLSSTDGALDPDELLGKPVTVTLTHDRNAAPRYFNGIVTEFGRTGYDRTSHQYRAVLRPWFWLLTQRADCRVLQNKSVSDIFAFVCGQAGAGDFNQNLSGTYAPWEYRVQYGESDFDFLSRLLEHEGIFYYFEHHKDRHVMVLGDNVGTLTTAPGCDSVPYWPPTEGTQRADRDHLSSWSLSKSFEAATFASREYNFETPSTVLSGTSSAEGRTDASKFELFEFPAGANPLDATGVEAIAKLRAQRLQSSQTQARGDGDAAGLAPGYLLALSGHPLEKLNKRYFVTAASYEMSADTGQTGGASGGAQFAVSIEAIDAREPYRPALLTRKPRIQGTQTAQVVGNSGAEISTDKYGRVKVQFHWDRVGVNNEDSSCWVRVAQPWAGRNWGAVYIPRIGDEVVVSFLDGDPDQPLIIGSVYNAEQMPPYTLPDNQTQSGIKTRSSPNGTVETFNEIRFEDKKGSEELSIHAERDLTLVVENNQTITIGADTKDKGDRVTSIYNDESLSVGHNLTLDVKNNAQVTVSNDRTTQVKHNDSLDVTSQLSVSAGDQITLKVGAAQIVLKSDGSVEISGSSIKVKGTSSAEIDATQTKVSGTQVNVTGTKTTVDGSATLDLTSSGVASLKGSLTKIG